MTPDEIVNSLFEKRIPRHETFTVVYGKLGKVIAYSVNRLGNYDLPKNQWRIIGTYSPNPPRIFLVEDIKAWLEEYQVVVD